jgi:hypothetical protein
MLNMKKLIITLAAIALAGCSSTEYPVFKNTVYKNFMPVEKSKDDSRQTKSAVTITDLGKVNEQIVPPVNVQACDGTQLLVTQVTRDGKPALKEVMEIVDPFANMHVRRVMIENNTDHTITLGTVDGILIDPNGNDHEMSSRDSLERHIQSQRPCSSTRAVVAAFDTVPFLANQIRVRPGRKEEVFVPFPNRNQLSMAGEWSFQLLDFPTGTQASGAVSSRDAFTFPIFMEEMQTTVRSQKDSFFAPWREIERNTVTIE